MRNASGSRFSTRNLEWQAHLQGIELASFRSRAWPSYDGAIHLLSSPSLFSSIIGLKAGDSLELSLEYGGLVTLPSPPYPAYQRFARGHPHPRPHPSPSPSSFPPQPPPSLEAGFGFLQYFKHPNHQTVHDRIAETIVVVNAATGRREAI